MTSERPWLYLILGSHASGRREVLADLIQAGLTADDRAAVILPDGESATPADAALPVAARWTLEGELARVELPAEATHVFLLLNGRENPVDQIEALAAWLPNAACELARVLCVVDCTLAEKHADLLAWYDACIHFSDVVLLGRREGVANKWMSDFRRRYAEQRMPCLFEMIKAGRVKNPALLLDPEARRLSHVFDADDWAGISLHDVEIGTGDGEEDGEALSAEELDPDDMPEVDPYFERKPGGYRVRTLPQITRFLD
ncbi:MAG: hypothetical protein ABII82_00665 [Verrucomicrobiota bacterium]